jgi:feruloyl esterase
MLAPLACGYATFASDSGHAGTSADASFATNPEAPANYALDAVKKTRDSAVFLIAARYGHPAAKLYFHGSSNGGKEAFGMIQRYPPDLDGARDGVISNPHACEAHFDPATVAGEKLRWPDGKDSSDRCLSDVQIAFLKTFDTPGPAGFQTPPSRRPGRLQRLDRGYRFFDL